MKQILYASVSAGTAGKPLDVAIILERSRHNNALDGITGLLWTDGELFLQVLEGDDEAVDECYSRIRSDVRHRGIMTIAERRVEEREFGYWAMAHKQRNEAADAHDARVRRMMNNASADIAKPFLDLLSSAPSN